MSENPLVEKNQDSLTDFIISCNESLEDAGQTSANHAFNLGCFLGFIPAIIFIALAFLLTRGSWTTAGLIAVLMGIALLGLANLTAITARKNSFQRAFKTEISPQIDAYIEENGIDRATLEKHVEQVLPELAPLRNFILSTTMNGSQSGTNELEQETYEQNNRSI